MIVHSSRKYIEQSSCSWVYCCLLNGFFCQLFISHAAERIWNHWQGSAIWKEPISTPLQNEDFWAWWGCSQIKILVLCCQVEENQEVAWRSCFLQTGLHCVNNIIEAIAAWYSDYFIWESMSRTYNTPRVFYMASVYLRIWLNRGDKISTSLKVAPYSFLTAQTVFENLARWRKLSDFMPKSHMESRSKMSTNMASKFLKFVYWKCCVDQFQFQNIYQLNQRAYLSLLDLKGKFMRYAGITTNEADFICLFDRYNHQAGQSKIVYYHTYL